MTSLICLWPCHVGNQYHNFEPCLGKLCWECMIKGKLCWEWICSFRFNQIINFSKYCEELLKVFPPMDLSGGTNYFIIWNISVLHHLNLVLCMVNHSSSLPLFLSLSLYFILFFYSLIGKIQIWICYII